MCNADNNKSKSALPNGGEDESAAASAPDAVSSPAEHSPKRMVLSHTSVLYSLESEWSNDKPKSDPQWDKDNVRISVCPTRHVWTKVVMYA